MTTRADRTSTRRRRLREAVVRVLYSLDLGDAPIDDALAGYRDNLAEGPVQADLEEWSRAVHARLGEIDEALRTASTHWRLERMAALDRAVLRLGTWELLARADIPAKVTINEAVEIARRYGGEESPAFVNGILDRVARQIQARRTEMNG